MFRRLGTSLANHRASLSSELGSLWDFFKIDKDRRRSQGTYEAIESKSPVRLARDLLQVVQETVFAKKVEEKRCPLVKEESDLSSDEEEGTEKRVANLIDFFFTIVKSQKEDRKGSGGSCFKTETSTEEVYVPTEVNTELEKKMETLIEFLASSGCTESEDNKEDNKITLMEFLFGADEKWNKPVIEISGRGMSLSESDVNIRNFSYIDETPEENTLVEMLLKYMDTYSTRDHNLSVTPLSEKSKSDTTISKLETFSDFSKTKSDSTLTHTQDTVIERFEDRSQSRRISETVVDLSQIKTDIEEICEEAVLRVCELRMMDDTMSEQEDIDNYHSYMNPAQYSYPYSVELSDILEEEEPSSRKLSQEDRQTQATLCAHELLKYIEEKIQKYPYDDSSGPSTEELSREFDLSPSHKSQSLVDLRNIPDLPPSFIIKPKVVRVDKSTSTTEISESISESRRIDSSCMTEDTNLTTDRSERALDKLESLHRFFSRSRLEIIDEGLEENGDRRKGHTGRSENKGQASLDDVEDLLDDNDRVEREAEREAERESEVEKLP